MINRTKATSSRRLQLVGAGLTALAWPHSITAGDDQSHESDVKPSPTTCRRGLDRAGLHLMTGGDDQPHESDVKPSPATCRRGLDRAGLHSMTGGDDQPHESDVKPSPTTCRRGLDRAGLHSMTGGDDQRTQATSSRRLQPVGANTNLLSLAGLRGSIQRDVPPLARRDRPGW